MLDGVIKRYVKLKKGSAKLNGLCPFAFNHFMTRRMKNKKLMAAAYVQAVLPLSLIHI